MKKEAYEQYMREADNWLHGGRRRLLETCLGLYCPSETMDKEALSVLEIGAGSGENIGVLSNFGAVDAIEIEPIATEVLKNNTHVRQLFTQEVPFTLDRKYDVLCAMDVLEHVEDDKHVFRWMAEHLNEDGILFLTVPAYQSLFSYHDAALNHFRRYRIGQLVGLNEDQLLLLKKGYFNSTLFPLAAVSRILGRIRMKRNKVQKKQSSTVPPYLDWLFSHVLKAEVSLIRSCPLFPYGLTAFAVYRKRKPIA